MLRKSLHFMTETTKRGGNQTWFIIGSLLHQSTLHCTLIGQVFAPPPLSRAVTLCLFLVWLLLHLKWHIFKQELSRLGTLLWKNKRRIARGDTGERVLAVTSSVLALSSRYAPLLLSDLPHCASWLAQIVNISCSGRLGRYISLKWPQWRNSWRPLSLWSPFSSSRDHRLQRSLFRNSK